jgi:hypothetical protein
MHSVETQKIGVNEQKYCHSKSDPYPVQPTRR